MARLSNRRRPIQRSAGNSAKRVRSACSGNAAPRAILLLFTVLVVAIIVIWGISSRRKANAQLSQETRELAIPTVTVIHPKRGAPQQEIVLPGDMQPYIDAPIYARTTGYLKSWHADITATRYKDLMKSDSVAQQDVDNANGNYEARRTAVESARSNVKRLEDLQSFTKIYAPFDGVITARNTDIGQLIDSGSSGGTSRELFHIAAVSRLRVYVNVPQVYSPQIKAGLHAQLTLAEFPGRHFDGMVVRDTGAIDNTTRTLLTEIDVNNPTGELKPGGYVEVHLTLPTSVTTFMLPVNAIIFKSAGMQVATVKDGK